MSNNPIIIICGEPNSVFSEIIYKSFRKFNKKRPIILIGSQKLLSAQFKKIGLKLDLNLVNFTNKKIVNLNRNLLNIFNVDYKFSKENA